jgi:hypothetical protein
VNFHGTRFDEECIKLAERADIKVEVAHGETHDAPGTSLQPGKGGRSEYRPNLLTERHHKFSSEPAVAGDTGHRERDGAHAGAIGPD